MQPDGAVSALPSVPEEPLSIRRGAATLGGATVLGHVSQFAWLGFGSRTMSASTFGTVLAAQALYGFLQIVIDNGPAFYGARLAATRRIDATTRGSLVRVRLQLALACAVLSVALGAAVGTAALRANAAFAVALLLFAALNYWEPYGRGDVRPWSAYVVLRSVAPAGAACALFVFGRTFPPELAGIAECAVVLTVSICFGLSGRSNVVRALSSPSGPWRNVTRIGLPVVIGQMGFASGTILLSATGAATAAAAFAVSLRLVTGINQLTGTVAAALFPRLAGGASGDEVEARGIETALRALVTLTFGVSGLLMLRPTVVTSLFLAHAAPGADAGAICMLATSCASGFVVLFTLVVLARNGESAFLPVYGTATGTILAGGILIALVSPRSPALAMALVFGLGQIAGMLVLARRALLLLPQLRGQVLQGATAALLLTGVGILAAATPALRPSAGVVTIVAALAAAARPAMRRRLVAPAPETARPRI